MIPFRQAHCLFCHEAIQPTIGWGAIFSVEKEKVLCPICEGKFEKIEGETCLICSRPFQFIEEKFRHHDWCYDCLRWEEEDEWKGLLERNISIFLYNDFLKEVLARFKYRGDYVLAKIFQVAIKEELQKIKPDLFVPISLSAERLKERGFNQTEALIIEAGFTPAAPLSRIHSEKQSKKSRTERIHIPQVFQLDPTFEIIGKKVLLIDDIYTTGSTLRHAARLLKEAGANSVQSLTLAR